ncbi:MAG: host attachment protein [Xanthobacteraceae bacterium]
MSNLKIHHGDWVVVCDGKKALLLENAGDEKFLNLKTREVVEHPLPSTNEQDTERAEKASRDGRRGAVEHLDWQDQDEDRFLHRLVEHLEMQFNGASSRSLVLVAPPRALGVLRQAYSHKIRAALAGEIDKDLVRLPVHEIERHLAG